MNEQEFQTRLAELSEQIDAMPENERDRVRSLLEETRERHHRLRATVRSLQDSLDHLRLSVKYLVFDLEATRRENNYLRRMLRETPGDEENEGAD